MSGVSAMKHGSVLVALTSLMICTNCWLHRASVIFVGSVTNANHRPYVFDAASSGHNEISTMLMKLEKNLLKKVNEIEARLTKIEDKPVATEEVQQPLEHMIDQIRTNNEPVVQAVQEAIQEDKAEELEIDCRRTNVLTHGVPESDDDSADQSIEDDTTVHAAMF